MLDQYRNSLSFYAVSVCHFKIEVVWLVVAVLVKGRGREREKSLDFILYFSPLGYSVAAIVE